MTELSGLDGHDRGGRRRRRRGAPRSGARAAVGGLAGVVLAGCAGASDNVPQSRAPDAGDQNALVPRGDEAQQIHDLFTPFAAIAIIIGILVIGAVVFAALRFRARTEDERPRQVHGNTGLEIAWTIAPAILLLVMGVPTVSLVFDLAERPQGDDVVRVEVIGNQWWWEFRYYEEVDGEDRTLFYTANEMVIPVDRKVDLAMTSSDVLHSFWVPNLNGKKDVAPGRVHHLTISANEPGLYLGQCAEYCGLSHANMRIRVEAVDDATYESWLEERQRELTPEQLDVVTDGVVAAYGCADCHAFRPDQGPGIGPNLTHLASRTTFAGAIFDLDEDHLRRWVRDAPSMKPMQTGDQPGPAPNDAFDVPGMPAFPNMTDEDLDEIVGFLLSLE